MVYYNGEWGTVCDDNFAQIEANVACQSMGYGLAKTYSSTRQSPEYAG